jgi:hypothetical protein
MEYFVMLAIHSNEFSHSPDETYAILDSYLSFSENSMLDLAKNGIIVSTKPDPLGGVCWVKVQFFSTAYKFMHEALLAELQELASNFDSMCEAHMYQTTIEFLETNIASAGESAVEGGWREEAGRLNELYKRVMSEELTLDELEQIIKDEHYA